MTQTLDVSERVLHQEPRTATAARQARATTGVDKLQIFVVTFSIAGAIIYPLFQRWNWPLFTYHPVVNHLDLFRAPGIPEDGPPIFWFGLLPATGIAAAALATIATAFSAQSVQRATVFFCVLAGLWPIFYGLGLYIDKVASFNAPFLRSIWSSGVPALAGAVAAGYLVSAERAARLWAGWLMIMPIGGLILLGYWLRDFFER
jgi:hypothetical protein